MLSPTKVPSMLFGLLDDQLGKVRSQPILATSGRLQRLGVVKLIDGTEESF